MMSKCFPCHPPMPQPSLAHSYLLFLPCPGLIIIFFSFAEKDRTALRKSIETKERSDANAIQVVTQVYWNYPFFFLSLPHASLTPLHHISPPLTSNLLNLLTLYNTSEPPLPHICLPFLLPDTSPSTRWPPPIQPTNQDPFIFPSRGYEPSNIAA